MKEKIKNATILGKTVRPDKAQMLKQVQHDMEVVQDDMLIKNDGDGKTVGPENGKILKQVQGDMEMSRHCERIRSNPAYHFARSADKVLSLFTFHLSPKDTLTSHFSQRSTFTSHLSQRFAFTLAEVLITLGIIGIVAAMTMPSLIAKYQKKQTVTQLKKAYAELNKAVSYSEIDNGDCKYWDYNLGSLDFYNKYLSKYLNKVDILLASKYNGGKFYGLNGKLDGEAWDVDPTYYVKLADGFVLGISSYGGGNYKAIVIDINGEKGPSINGKDLFVFSIQGDIKVAPYGIRNTDSTGGIVPEYDRGVILGGHGRACTKKGSGAWCAALIIADGWEIKDDYPW